MRTAATLIRRLVQNGMGMVELHATWVEPRFNDPGVSAAEAREKLRTWRVAPSGRALPAAFGRNSMRRASPCSRIT